MDWRKEPTVGEATLHRVALRRRSWAIGIVYAKLVILFFPDTLSRTSLRDIARQNLVVLHIVDVKVCTQISDKSVIVPREVTVDAMGMRVSGLRVYRAFRYVPEIQHESAHHHRCEENRECCVHGLNISLEEC